MINKKTLAIVTVLLADALIAVYGFVSWGKLAPIAFLAFFVLKGILVSRIAGGQIAESWLYWDQADVLEQLGLIHHRAGPPGRVPTPAG